MRFVIGMAACLGVLSVALAEPPSSPTTATSSDAAPAAASATTSAPVSPAKPAADKPSVTVSAELDAQEKHLLAEGYKMQMQNGEKVFCKTEVPTGQRLGYKKTCGSALQLTQNEREAQMSVNKSMMQQNNPSGK